MANLTLASGLLTGFVVLAGLTATTSQALAQSSDPTKPVIVDPNEGFSSPDGGGNFLEDSSSALDLIHRAVLMNNMSLDEFSNQLQSQFSNETNSFQQRQQEAIRQRNLDAVDPVTPETDN